MKNNVLLENDFLALEVLERYANGARYAVRFADGSTLEFEAQVRNYTRACAADDVDNVATYTATQMSYDVARHLLPARVTTDAIAGVVGAQGAWAVEGGYKYEFSHSHALRPSEDFSRSFQFRNMAELVVEANKAQGWGPEIAYSATENGCGFFVRFTRYSKHLTDLTGWI